MELLLFLYSFFQYNSNMIARFFFYYFTDTSINRQFVPAIAQGHK